MIDLIDLFIERMTVLGRDLVFQPVLVTHTCTYSNNNIITLQNIDITDFPSNKKRKKNPTPLPSPKPTTTTTKGDTSEWFWHVTKTEQATHKKKDKNQNQMTNIIEST